MEVNWDDTPLKTWLGGISKKGTLKVYRSAWKTFHEYLGKTASELLDEAEEDSKLPRKDRKNVLKSYIMGFHRWLKEEKEFAPKTARNRVNAIRSFFTEYGFPIKLKGRSKIPHAKPMTTRARLTPVDVKILLDNATNPRDRAILLFAFQGGQGLEEIQTVKYGSVREGLEKDEYPLTVKQMYRGKAGVFYYTFLGRDGIASLKAYFNYVKKKGTVFTDSTPLFVTLVGKPKQMSKEAILKVMRTIHERSGLNGKIDIHALRESFGSIMSSKGVPDSMVHFWLGHTVGELSEIYLGRQYPELKRMYKERELFLAVTIPASEEVKTLKEEVDRKDSEYGRLFQQLIEFMAETTKRMEKIEKKPVPNHLYASVIPDDEILKDIHEHISDLDGRLIILEKKLKKKKKRKRRVQKRI